MTFTSRIGAWQFITRHMRVIERYANISCGSAIDVEGKVLAIQERLPLILEAVEYILPSYPNATEEARAKAIAFWKPKPEELEPTEEERT